MVPYLVKNFVFFQIVKIIAIVANFILLFITIYQITEKKEYAFLSTILAFVALRYYWNYNTLTSYPFVFTNGLNFTFLSIIFLIKGIREKNIKPSVLSALFFFTASIFYESFLLYISLLTFLFVYEIFKRQTEIKRLIDNYIYLLPQHTAFILYVIIYIIFKLVYPAQYSGLTINLNEIPAMFRTIFQYTVSGLPLIEYNLKFYVNYLIKNYSSLINFMLNSNEPVVMVKSVMVFICTYVVIYSKDQKKFTYRKFFHPYIFIFLVFLPFQPNVLLGLTQKYQDWVLIHGIKEYTCTYFSYFSWIVLIIVIIFYISRITSNNILRQIYTIIISLCVVLTSFLTDYSNSITINDQKISHMRWLTFDYVIQKNKFENNSMIFSPTLFNSRSISLNHDTYWSEYLSAKYKKNIEVTKDINRAIEFNKGNNGRLYF
jgi:hypothetical protein